MEIFSSYEDLAKFYLNKKVLDCKNFPNIGTVYYGDNEFYKGYYWFYENDKFVFDIHDFFIKKDFIEEFFKIDHLFLLASSYIMSGSGEWINPYKPIDANSIFILDPSDTKTKYLLHGNSHYFIIGVKFKENFFDEEMLKKIKLKKNDLSEIFISTQNFINKKISKVANEVLNCKMEGISAEIFLHSKAIEWLSITFDAYFNASNNENFFKLDKEAIESVAKYLEDHFSLKVNLNILEQISAMSSTKLKTTFKKKYKMTITEFVQRKRVNVAENFLLNTDMEIKDIAKAVGYKSQSRFSLIFKRYKGIYPKEIRKFAKLNKG